MRHALNGMQGTQTLFVEVASSDRRGQMVEAPVPRRRVWAAILTGMAASVVLFISHSQSYRISLNSLPPVARKDIFGSRPLFGQGAADEITNSTSSRRRVVVFTVWTHYPDLMKIHTATARTFLSHGDHPVVEVVAIINAVDYSIRLQLIEMAAKLQIHTISLSRAKEFEGLYSLSHAYALNFALFYLLRDPTHLTPQFPQQDDILLVLDSDMFFFESTSLIKELKGADVMSPLQTRGPSTTYLWPNLICFSFKEWMRARRRNLFTRLLDRFAREPPYRAMYDEIDFDSCDPECPSCDTGGCTYFFLQDHPELKVANWIDMCSDSSSSASSEVCRFWKNQTENTGQLPTNCVAPETFGSVFHSKSAGSNWRGCDENFLRDRREDLLVQAQRILSQDVLDRHDLKDT